MKRALSLALGLLCLACGGKSVVVPQAPSRLSVHIAWQGQDVPGDRVDVLELGLTQVTDAAGLAEFVLPAGTFTVRAYVNGPGPALPSDQRVTLERGRTTRLEIADCLPCVGPR